MPCKLVCAVKLKVKKRLIIVDKKIGFIMPKNDLKTWHKGVIKAICKM